MNSKYKELSDIAYKCHSNNNLEEAEKIYIKLLQINPDDVNILNLYGLLCIAKKEYSSAIKYLTQAFILKRSAYIGANLAKAYYSDKQYDKSLKIYSEALDCEQNDDIYYSMALSYKALGDYDNAV